MTFVTRNDRRRKSIVADTCTLSIADLPLTLSGDAALNRRTG